MFDARAESYDESAMHRWLAGHAVSMVSVGEHALVVDVAAGTGLAGRALRRRQPSARVLAVDLSPELLRVARGHGLSAVRADAERLPMRSRTVEAVLCVSAAAYFPHPQRALNEFIRVLRPGGSCLIQTWREDTSPQHGCCGRPPPTSASPSRTPMAPSAQPTASGRPWTRQA
jgi:ubiquinone/menaquinone biosynthesis C-methylase UbiE